MHKPSFASLTVLHYFAGTSHPPIKIRSPILDVHLHPRFGLTWNLVADFGILGSTILAVVTHGTTDVQHGHTIYHDRTITIYPGIPFFNPLTFSFIVVLVVYLVLPPSWFIGPLCSLCQILTKDLTNKMLMHVKKNYLIGFVFEHSFQKYNVW